VKGIDRNGFKKCVRLATVIFSAETALRGIAGFCSCQSLKRIEIPVSVDAVSGFNRCDFLDEAVFAPGQEFGRFLDSRPAGCGDWTSWEDCRGCRV